MGSMMNAITGGIVNSAKTTFNKKKKKFKNKGQAFANAMSKFGSKKKQGDMNMPDPNMG